MHKLILGILIAPAFLFASRLINGTPVNPGTFKEVILIDDTSQKCTATIIGPRVFITAGHCVTNGGKASFTVNGTHYEAVMTTSPLISTKDHDIALGVTSKEITGIAPATIGGSAKTGLEVSLLGYGCTAANSPTGDGILRMGNTVIISLKDLAMISKKADGAVMCYGDGGGPAFITDSGKRRLLGINFNGNLKDSNLSVRTDLGETQTFLKNFAQQNSVDICGINKECETITPPVKPTCTLTANPQSITLGESLTFSIVTQGEVTSASVNGTVIHFPTGQIVVRPPQVGSFIARASIIGPGGSNSCETSYVVKDTQPITDKPSCTLTATPDPIKLGESVTLEINTTGKVTTASIEGTSVTFPLGKIIVKPAQKGSYTANATVTGPGGSNSCWTNYHVTEGTVPSETPNFAVVPTACGENTITETKVARVCLSILKRDNSLSELSSNYVVLVTYADTTKEVLPVLVRQRRLSNSGDSKIKEDLYLYTNTTVPAKGYLVLDTRKAVLTSSVLASGELIPTAIEGRTATGKYFLVDKLE